MNTTSISCSDFSKFKVECLSKRDKSSAGRIDFKAVKICGLLNQLPQYFTTSSCAGRCFLYTGTGSKQNDYKDNNTFERFRVNHDLIRDCNRYFNLFSLKSDLCGGGDPVPSVGQYDMKQTTTKPPGSNTSNNSSSSHVVSDLWLRFEPFILHLSCRNMTAAKRIMDAARPVFKNVGITTISQTKIIVAVWGDEGLDMPLVVNNEYIFQNQENFLQEQINSRHLLNWSKIERLEDIVRAQLRPDEDLSSDDGLVTNQAVGERGNRKSHKFETIGDIALLNSIDTKTDPTKLAKIGEEVLSQNKALRVCAVRTNKLIGDERCPGEDGVTIIAGANRSPLVTTHSEYGIKCVVDIENVFFTPRMGPERLRICQQVARGENVLALFTGCGMDALQVAGRTEATKIIAVELNPVAAECARRGKRMLVRNKAVKVPGAADRLDILEGDAMEVLRSLDQESFHRVLAPRPKDKSDGDIGEGDSGARFLELILPVMKSNGGECHWYDFAADHELPKCERTVSMIKATCQKLGYEMRVINVASVGSIAMRQYRVCIDFRLIGRCPT